MPFRIGSSLGIAAGLLGGLFAGLAVSAGAAAPNVPTASQAPAPSATDYEIVRSTFSAKGQSADGTARCSEGKLVMGGGARVLDEGTRHYAIVASDPLGPSGWSATFVRHPEAEGSPVVPGRPAPEEEGETEFEVTAVCAAVR
ncbi:MAG: hypothetical protein ACRD0O_01170 [Acidimicrobiia bacterium]